MRDAAVQPVSIVRRALTAAVIGACVAIAPGAPLAAAPTSDLVFEPLPSSGGQPTRFLTRARGYQVWIEPGRLVLQRRAPDGSESGPGEPVELVFARSSSDVQTTSLRGEERRTSVSHYLKGDEPRRRVPHYGRVRQPALYPGVDVVYYGREGVLEYDFELAAGVDPASIALDLGGVDRVEIDAQGGLLLHSGASQLHQPAPFAHQIVEGSLRPIPCRWERRGEERVGFAIAAYDRGAPLVIDPQLSFSTYLGGTVLDVGRRVVTDVSGDVLLVGRTASTDLPVENALQPGYGGAEHDAFLAKYDEGGDLIFATYIGGSGEDWGYDVDIDAAGYIYVAGRTASTDLPVARGFQSANGGGIDAFVAKLDPSGSEILYLTYLGGTGEDRTRGLVVASDGSVFVTGQTDSTDLPTVNPLQADFAGGARDALVAHISPHGGTLLFSTYLGGADDDVGVNLRVRDGGDVVIAGFTSSADFPTLNAHQVVKAGTYDLFVAKIARDGSALLYSTLLGGSGDGSSDPDEEGLDVDLDAAQNAYVAGRSSSTDFPVLNALQPALAGDWDATVSKFAPDGVLLYSTYLGGVGRDESRAIAVDDEGFAHLTGRTTSTDFPTLNAVQTTLAGAEDAFVSALAPDGSSLVYSTYLGGAGDDDGFGIDLDRVGNVYVAGETSSTDFPTRRAEQPSNGGFFDGFVSKIATAPEVTVSLVDDGGVTDLGVELRNGDTQLRSALLKLWIEVPAAGVTLPILSTVYPLNAGASLTLLADLPLPAGLPFPGSIIGARLLDPDTGALIYESICDAVPCH